MPREQQKKLTCQSNQSRNFIHHGEKKMLIKTKDFDYVDISENDIIAFPNGIYGFDGVDKFVLLKNPENQCSQPLTVIRG